MSNPGWAPSPSSTVMRKLDLAVKGRDYARGNLAVTSEGLRLLILDMAEELDKAARQEIRNGR